MSIPSSHAVDWQDQTKVCEYADGLGYGLVVYKHPNRLQYNICHKADTERYDLSWVIYETRPAHGATRRAESGSAVALGEKRHG